MPETSVDTFAQPSISPTLIGTFWAEVRPLKGDEMLNVRQIWATATHIITMRWLGSAIPSSTDNPNGIVIPEMKFINVADGEVYNVLFAENVEKRDRQWKITAAMKSGATT